MFYVKQRQKEQEKEEKRRRKRREGEGLQKEVCSYAPQNLPKYWYN